MNVLKVKISSPQEKIFDGELESITIKTISGVITILPRHIPYISLIQNGYVKYSEGKEIKNIDITDGNVSVSETGVVTILINK